MLKEGTALTSVFVCSSESLPIISKIYNQLSNSKAKRQWEIAGRIALRHEELIKFKLTGVSSWALFL